MLEKASTKMQEVVAKLNEDQRVAENREKLEEIQARFSDKVCATSPLRLFHSLS